MADKPTEKDEPELSIPETDTQSAVLGKILPTFRNALFVNSITGSPVSSLVGGWRDTFSGANDGLVASVWDKPFLPASFEDTTQLRKEIDELRRAAAEQAKALSAAKSGTEKHQQTILQLKSSMEQLELKERLRFLLDRVHPMAQQHLHHSREFQAQFLSTRECSAFVMSVDIRRSTELMLKARSAEQFADFITGLCENLTTIVRDSFGVFDKFTGDGILAFFPDFYSGADAAYRVVMAADQCHAAFERHYHESRKSFKTVLTDVGLGIGIDYGLVRLVQVAGGLTVVGEPVVYACRFSGAPPKVTLVNQPAYEEVSTKFGGFCFTEEKPQEIKHEGRILAYEVRLNGRPHTPKPPEWLAAPTEGVPSAK